MAVSRVGSAQASTTTVTLPAHQVGDLIVIWAYNGTNATVPTVPSSPAYTAVAAGTAGTSSAGVLGYRIATSASETSGTWTNATKLIVHVYRGAVIGANAAASASSSASINYAALTLQDTSGTSWVAGFGAHKTSALVETAPAGMTNVISNATAAPEAAGHDTNGGVTSWPLTAASVGTTGQYRSWVVEIKQSAAGAANVTGAQTLSATTQTSSITVPAGAALFMRPSSDVSTGGWTNETGGTALFASLDEMSASDSDYIQSGLAPVADVAEVHLSDPTGALASATLRFRIGKAVNDATVINIVAALVQGATVIASWTYTDVAFGYTLKTETLTAPQLAAITNANDLRIRFTADTPVAGLTPPEGTNLLANENDLSHSQYTRQGLNLIVNADGVADGIAYLPGGSNANVFQILLIPVILNDQYRVSLKVKKPATLGVRYVVFQADETNIVNGAARVAFDLDTNSVVAAYAPTATNTSAGVLDLGDGYKMCWLKYIQLTSYAGVLTWHPGDGSGSGYSEIGDGVTPNQLWKGWKLENLGPP